MTHFNIDPWIEGQTIHSIVAGLSLSKTNGSGIPVANLTEEIEVTRLKTSWQYRKLKRWSVHFLCH